MAIPSILLEIIQRWLESIPVIVTLLFGAIQLRQMKLSEQVGNQLTIVEHHPQIWSRLFDNPELGRILDPNVNLAEKPITEQESLFVTFLILHLRAVLRAKKADMFTPAQHLEEDIAWIFSLPIPKKVWIRSKSFQDPELVALVEGALNDQSRGEKN